MLKINYYIHIILHSKYKKLIEYLLILIIYITCLEGHYTYCMNNGLVPEIAEPKVPVVRGIQPLTPLQIEVSKFLGYDDIIKQQKTIIQEQKVQIAHLNFNNTLRNETVPLIEIRTLPLLQRTVDMLTEQDTQMRAIFSNTRTQLLVTPDGNRVIMTEEEADRLNRLFTEKETEIRRLKNENEFSSSTILFFLSLALIGYTSAWSFYGISPLKLFLGPIKW